MCLLLRAILVASSLSKFVNLYLRPSRQDVTSKKHVLYTQYHMMWAERALQWFSIGCFHFRGRTGLQTLR